MDVMSDLDRFKSEMATTLLRIFNDQQNLSLLHEMHRTYLYASLFPWNKESGRTIGSSTESAPVRFLGSFGYTFCHLSPHQRDLEVMPSTYSIPEEPTFEQWLSQIQEAIRPALESNERLKLTRSRFQLSVRRNFNDGLYSADRLEQFLLKGICQYVGFWQNAASLD